MVFEDANVQALYRIMSAHQPGIIGVSGGVDSSLLAWLAGHWELDYLAVFLDGTHLSPAERMDARDFLCSLSLPSAVGRFSPVDVPGAAGNPVDRCYHCKTAMTARLRAYGLGNRTQIVDGSHLSDQGEYRPGSRALREQGVISPLARAGLFKEDVCRYARTLGLQQADRPSSPCLMTRFAYGYKVTQRELQRIGEAEDRMRRIGLRYFRIRVPDGDSFLVHIHFSEKKRALGKQEQIHDCMNDHGLVPFYLEYVCTLSGFFDKQGLYS